MHQSWLESLGAIVAVQLLAAAAVLLLQSQEARLRRALPLVIAVAVGVLLGTGLGHLLPEAVEALGSRPALWMTFTLTILALYAVERLFQALSGVRAEPSPDAEASCGEGREQNAGHGHHHHHHASRPAALLLGSVLHSLVDGTSIAAAFAVDRRVGWVTALAVGLHEVPHRLGDFALLLHMGVARGRAAWLAVGAGASGVLGWGVVVAIGSQGAGRVAWLLPVSAGSFVYIALVDLLPELQGERRTAAVMRQVVCLLLGVLLAFALTRLPGA
jgi:zinc and cadmium transporter